METSKTRQWAVRLAAEEDLAQTYRIWSERAALLQQTAGFHQSKSQPTPAWYRYARTWLHSDEYAFFVAEVNEEVTGYIVVTIAMGPVGLEPVFVGRVVDMAVDLHEPNPGLCGALLDEARHWLQGRSIELLTIDVPARYPVEEAFWRAQGARLRFNQHWLAL